MARKLTPLETQRMLHGGDARADVASACQVLRWFKEREPINVRLRHVLDFLNQMGWLTEVPVVVSDAPRVEAVGWHLDRENWDGAVPSLVSVRPMLDADADNPAHRYGASIVFEDGIFGCISMLPPAET